MRERMAQRFGEIVAEIAKARALALVEIFGDAAGKRHGVDAPIGERGWPALGHQQAARQLARLPQIDHAHDEAGHALGDPLAVGGCQRLDRAPARCRGRRRPPWPEARSA